MNLNIYCDASWRRNGDAYIGIVIQQGDTHHFKGFTVDLGKTPGCHMAELEAIRFAIEFVSGVEKYERINIYNDCSGAVNQANGFCKVKERHNSYSRKLIAKVTILRSLLSSNQRIRVWHCGHDTKKLGLRYAHNYSRRWCQSKTKEDICALMLASEVEKPLLTNSSQLNP